MYPSSISTLAKVGISLLLASRVRAQDRTTEQGEAAINDPAVECAIYSYPPVASAVAGGQFPPIWQPVTSVPANDTEGRAKFLAINGSIPAISPKGTMAGDFSNFTPTYSSTDPDCWWTYHQCTTPKLSGLSPDVASVPEPRTLGYGFDDGPNCSHNAFYDYLSARGQSATMFFIGSNVLDWPLEAQRAIADGHEVCAHTWSHRYMTSFTNEGAFGELWYSLKAIKLVTGVTPKCWRPPYGDVDDRIRYIATQLGLETVIWKYDSFDWMVCPSLLPHEILLADTGANTHASQVGTNGVTQATVQANYDALIGNVSAGTFDTVGAIMLTHELNNFTMQAAIDNYPALVKAFDHLVPIAVAQNKTQPYVETNYTMPSFAQYISNHSAASSLKGLNDTSASGSGSGQGAQATGSGAGVSMRLPVRRSVGVLAAFVVVTGAMRWAV
ncbi:Carbohydrate esterase family 4 protein [Mycena venus]|uniref:chitin deacetylase n=1 Tax=Mycena venus TaxID=2733690 RepID=A0A8H6Z2K1_9AGAR|nr:Carbohydrate esterase family 4 protein [Mycena venus]